MAVTYKDIDLLTQKPTVAGTEKIPVSDTQYITPEQIVDDLLDPQSVSEVDLLTPVETSYPSGGFRSNTIYDLGTLTGSQTFALYTTGIDATVKNEWVWSFVTGSTAPTITWPSGITWDGGSAPTVNASCLYEISVRKIGSYYVGYYKEIALS